MQTKLTLRLDDQIIKLAKSFARKKGKSVSQLVADYFKFFKTPRSEEDYEIAPIVRSLKGILRGSKVDVEDYKRHLEEKYL
jgi:hypothetical protein